MSHSDQAQQDMEITCTLNKDGDHYKLQSFDGKLTQIVYKVDVSPQCRFVKRQKAEMPFFFQVYYDEDYEQTDLEKYCRSHGLTEISSKAYIQHCKDAHPCLIMHLVFPAGGSSEEELFNSFSNLLKTRYLAHRLVDPAHWDYWFDNMGTPIFFEGEKVIPIAGNRMETMVDAYFVAHLEDGLGGFTFTFQVPKPDKNDGHI